MTFGEFQEQGFDLTEKEIAVLEREIIQVYRDVQKSIAESLEKVYAKLAGIDPSNAGYYNELLKRDRLAALLTDVTAQLNTAIKKTDGIIGKASELATSNNYYRQLYASAWSGVVTFGAIPDELVRIISFGTEEAWKSYTAAMVKKFGDAGLYLPKEGTLSEILLKNRQDAIVKIRQTITQGLIQGQSVTQMTNSIKDVTGREIVKDGKKAYTGAKANATRIIRTETGRCMNAGAFAQTKLLESEGVQVQKRWLATLDTRTRARHAHMDGKTIDVDERFSIGGDTALYPGDFGLVKNNVNCRCATIDIIPGFEPDVRTGRNPLTEETEVFSWKTFDQWAKDNGLKRLPSGRLVSK